MFLRGLFSNDLLVELSTSKISIKVFSSDIKYEDAPYIAIEKTSKGQTVKAIGKLAKREISSNITISNPFNHPRSFVGDFFLAELIIMHGIFETHESWVKPAPRIIMHQTEKVEGGLTNIEHRVLRELAIGAGAREVVVYLGNKINTFTDDFDAIKCRVSAT